MTPQSPIDPRQALEASLTALILGELPSDQAEFLQRAIAGDPELCKQYERLKSTIGLLKETQVTLTTETAAQPARLKLSNERRQALLQRFKTISPQPFANVRRSSYSWLVPVA